MHAIAARKRSLFVFALWLALVSLMVLEIEQQPDWQGTRLELPLVAGRSVHIRVGSQYDAMYQGLRFDQLPQIQYRRSTRVRVWYRAGIGAAGQRILAMPLPMWPVWLLLPTAGIIFGVVAGTGVQELRSRVK